MIFFNKYPYQDLHELNLDWVLEEMQALDKRLDNALAILSSEIYVKVMHDIEPTLQSIRSDINGLVNTVSELRRDFDALDHAVTDFETSVNNRLLYLQNYVDNAAVACNEYTNSRIEQNNNYILSELSTYLKDIKVINFFTGELVSVQDMFDYLASLHTSDSIDYDTMVLRAKTYTQLAAFNKTYTELVMSGNTWYV